ncbi:MAG: gliding motility-associated C-terminal domain-containing protein [Candidatus Omnitrophica bacterium]|nr:gliding motility-associated C-terminal domain-containing protein [Candidatus Omnitrophota bacterium]
MRRMFFYLRNYILAIILVMGLANPASALPSSTILLTVTVDNALISNVEDAPDAFSPNQDGNCDTSTIAYQLGTSCNVSVVIYDADNNQVKVLKDSMPETAGRQSAVWDGKNTSGDIVDDGIYFYKVTALIGLNNIDSVQGQVTVDNKFMDWLSPEDNSVITIGQDTLYHVRPSAYITNEFDLKLYYRLKGNPDWIASNDNLEERADGSWFLFAEDSDAGNEGDAFEVAIGARYYDLNGLLRFEYTRPLTVTFSAAFNIYNVHDAPDAFSPNNDGDFDNTVISFSINRDAQAGLKIYDTVDNLVRVLGEDVSLTPGDCAPVWDGRDDFGNLLAEGEYVYKITADDGQGNVVEKQGSVVIDNSFMAITEPTPGAVVGGLITFKAKVTSPYVYQENNVHFYVREKGQTEWNQMSPDNPPIKQPGGSWAQSVDSLQGALNTDYEIRVSADYFDRNSELRTEYSGFSQFSILNGLKITKYKAVPNAFSPNGDARYDVTTIKYRINITADASVKIYDQNNVLVRTLKENISEPMGDNQADWDGLDNANNLAGEGAYIFEITATDIQSGLTDTVKGTVVINNHFMSIVEPAAGSKLAGDVVFKAIASENIQNERNIAFSYRQAGTENWIDIPVAAQKQPDGSWAVAWNVDSLNSGNYEVRVFADYDDLNNNFCSEYSGEYGFIIADYVKITNALNSPNAFSPNGDGKFEENSLSYEINKDSLVTIKVYDTNNNLVRILIEDIPQTAGGQTVIWNGRNNAGSVVTDGVYKYEIQARDNDGYEYQAQASVSVDNHFVTIEPVSGSNVSNEVLLKAFPSDFVKMGSMTFYYRLTGSMNGDGRDEVIGLGQEQPDGSWQVNWDTSILENGEYKITCRTGYADLDNNWREEDLISGPYFLTNGIKIFDVSDSPDAFSPNDDQLNDFSNINYKIANIDGTVSIKIFDSSDTMVRILKYNETQSRGEHTVLWDGKDEQGNLLYDGDYKYIIEAADSNNNTAVGQGQVTIDNHALVVTNPQGQSTISGTVEIRAVPSQYCRYVSAVNFYITHKYINGFSVNLGKAEQQPDGSWTASLDTTGLIDGMYKLTAYIGYSDLNRQPRSESVCSEYETANNNIVFNVSDSVDAFSPDNDGRYDKTVIRYSIGIESDVTIRIFDQNNSAVRTLQEKKHLTPGYYYNDCAWDGKDDSGNPAGDGEYTYAITAEHEPGHEETEQSTVAVDTKHAQIIEPAKDTSISGTVLFKIKPAPYMNEVRSIQINNAGYAQLMPDNTWQIYWDTTTADNGNYLINGYIEYTDRNGNYRTDSFLGIDCFVANNMTVSRNAFSPNNDNNFDTTSFYYNAAADGLLGLKIYDADNNPARVLAENEPVKAGKNSFVWDGKDDYGAVLADGVYTYKINISFNEGGTDNQEGTVTVDNHFMNIVSPLPDSEINGEVIFNARPSEYILNEKRVYFYIRKSGALEWQPIGGAARLFGDGTWYVVINTKDFANGQYELSVKAEYADVNGFTRTERTTPYLYRVSNAFDLSLTANTPDAFSPNGDGNCDITNIAYFINSDAVVSIDIFDARNNSARNLKTNISEQAGVNSAQWDGKDNNGILLSDGIYTFVISAENSLSEVLRAEDTVAIDNNFALITAPLPGSAVSGQVSFKIVPSDYVYALKSVFLKKMNSNNTFESFTAQKQQDGSYAVFLDTRNYPNGRYDFRVEADYYDRDQKLRSEKSPFINYAVENEAPDVTDLRALPNPFSPDESGTWLDPDTGEVFNVPAEGLILDDETTISFSASSFGLFSVKITDEYGRIIKQLMTNKLLYPDPATHKINFIWDGSGNTGNGCYYALINPGAAEKEQALEIIVDKMPVIIGASIFPNPFSPGQNGYNTTDIYFNISENAYVSVKIYDGENLIRNLVDGLWRNKGQCQVNWNGTSDAGEIVGGKYTVRIFARTAHGAQADPVELTIYISSLVNVSVSRQAINPYLNETVYLYYTLDKERTLTFKVFDDAGRLARTLIDKQQRQPGLNSEIWDGKDDNGENLPDGVYHFIVEETVDGVTSALYDMRGSGGQDISSTIPFTASDFDTSQNQLSLLSFDLPEAAYVTIKARNARYSGAAIRVIKFEEPYTPGQHQSYWDGRDEAGELLPYEQYFLGLWGFKVDTNAVLITGGSPGLSNMSVTPINFYPYNNAYALTGSSSQAKIGFNLSRDANVTIKAYNSAGSMIKTISDDVFYSAGNNIAYWDGKDNNANFTANGDYRIVIQARNKENYSESYILHSKLTF